MYSITSSDKSDLPQIVLYALPVFGVRLLVGPIVVLQGIYAKHFGLSLSSIAAVLLLARLFDAISDPLIGYFSDQLMLKTGTRKVLILVGGLLLIISSLFLYMPPKDVTAIYFATSFIVFYLASTLFEIPHMAWGAELTLDSNKRTKIYMVRQVVAYLGMILFFSVPLLPFFETNEVTPETIKWSTIVVSFLLLPLLYICLKNVPSGDSVQEDTKKDFRLVFISTLSNKPFRIFGVAYLFFGVGVGMWFGMLFIFIDGYFLLGEWFVKIYLLAITTGMFSTFLWSRLATNFGVKNVLVMAVALVTVSVFGFGFLSPDVSSIALLLILITMCFIGLAGMEILAPSLLANVVDYARWKYRTSNTGTYFSLYLLMVKATAGIGAAISLTIAGRYGFDPSVTDHSIDSIYGIKLATAVMPTAFMLVSLYFIMIFPINTRSYSIIRRRLALNKGREKCKLPSLVSIEDKNINVIKNAKKMNEFRVTN